MIEDETITGIKDLVAMIIERDKRIANLEEKALAAVNAPYEDILDMGLAQALMELKETINDPE